MWERTWPYLRSEVPGQAGSSLLEVLVALGLLAVSTLVIAESLGAAVEYAGAAEAVRRATATAAAVAETITSSADYPDGWRVVGTPGADGLPGTRDDDPPADPAGACERRVAIQGPAGNGWAWIEASCAGHQGVVALVTAR